MGQSASTDKDLVSNTYSYPTRPMDSNEIDELPPPSNEHKRKRKRDSSDSSDSVSESKADEDEKNIVLTVQRIPRKNAHSQKKKEGPRNTTYGFDSTCPSRARVGQQQQQQLKRLDTTTTICEQSVDDALSNGVVVHTSSNHAFATHTSKANADFNIRKPPRAGESHQRSIGDKTYYWCKHCNHNKGIWNVTHRTEQHEFNYRYRQHPNEYRGTNARKNHNRYMSQNECKQPKHTAKTSIISKDPIARGRNLTIDTGRAKSKKVVSNTLQDRDAKYYRTQDYSDRTLNEMAPKRLGKSARAMLGKNNDPISHHPTSTLRQMTMKRNNARNVPINQLNLKSALSSAQRTKPPTSSEVARSCSKVAADNSEENIIISSHHKIISTNSPNNPNNMTSTDRKNTSRKQEVDVSHTHSLKVGNNGRADQTENDTVSVLNQRKRKLSPSYTSINNQKAESPVKEIIFSQNGDMKGNKDDDKYSEDERVRDEKGKHSVVEYIELSSDEESDHGCLTKAAIEGKDEDVWESSNESVIDKVKDDLLKVASRSSKPSVPRKRIVSSKTAMKTTSKQVKISSQKKTCTKKGKMTTKLNPLPSDSTDDTESRSDTSDSYYSDEELANDSKEDVINSSEFSLKFHRLGTRGVHKFNNRGKSKIDEGEWQFLHGKLEHSSIEFLKSCGLFSVRKLVSSSTLKLARDYNAWRKSNQYDCVANSLSCAARWQAIAKTFHNGGKEEKISSNHPLEGNQMQIVPHLTKTVLGGGKLPIRYITVMQASGTHHKETLFDFRINIRESKIANSGYGAFLTFLGARKLKEEARKKSIDFLKDRIYVESDTTKNLQAKDGNFNMSVKLMGSDLHGNGDSNFFTFTRFPLLAKDLNGKEYSVKIGPHHIHEDIKELRKRKEMPFPENGLGLLCMFSDGDYESDNETKYSSEEFGIIDIGRYGPFLKTDRKTQVEFNFKDFIFDSEPAGWNFGVEELFKGCTQVIDVTGDCTGEPHTITMENIPMYVNEVGHDQTLVQNVIAREVDDRVVHYYFTQRKPLSKGETVELLVNYGDSYEATRIRKGYGLQNIREGLDCDKDESSKFKRDHADRASIKEMIKTMKLREIQNALVFLESQIFHPLIHYTNEYFVGLIERSRNPKNCERLQRMKHPTTRQLRARLRLNFLGEIFREQLDALVDPGNKTETIRKMYKCIDTKRLNPFVQFGYTSLRDEEELWSLYKNERCAEITLKISNGYDLRHAYDPCMWCSVARKLSTDLAQMLVETEAGYRRHSFHAQKLYKKAKDAADSIRKACQNLSSTTASTQTIIESCRLLGFVETSNEIINSHLKSTTRIGSDDGQINIDLVSTGYEEAPDNPTLGLSSLLELVCTSLTPHQKQSRRNCKLVLRCITSKEFSSMKYSAQLERDGHAKVDCEWYLLWQVIRVIDVFAKRFPQNSYFLKNLCEEVDVDLQSAELIASLEMKEPYEMDTHIDESFDSDYDCHDSAIFPTSLPETSRPNPNVTIHKQRSPKRLTTHLYDEVDGTLPEGWVLDKVKRQNSNHIDRYWYTTTKKKLRSRVEVEHFLKLIQSYGNEEAAWENFPANKRKSQRKV